MGLGFKVENQDFVLNGAGQLFTITGEEKLKRDFYKMIITTRKGNVGSELHESIGSKIKGTASQMLEIRRKVNAVISRLVDIQMTDNTLTSDEAIEQAKVYVYPDTEDRIKMDFVVELATAKNVISSSEFEVSL